MFRLYHTFILLTALSVSYGQNNLRLVSLEGHIFKVTTKNGAVNKTPQSGVLIENITDDTLSLNFEFENGETVNIPVYLLEKGKKTSEKEFNYKIENFGKPAKLIFSGVYTISSNRSPIVPAKPVIDTIPAYNNRFLGHLCELKNGEPSYFNNIPGNGKCAVKMPDLFLDYTRILMQKADGDDEKQEIVENICRNNCLSVDQFTVLLNYSGFEIEKMKLVKIAYFHFTDPENSKTLEKSFRFEASVNELNNFLKNPNDQYLHSGANCVMPADSSEINSFCAMLSILSNDNERYLLFKKKYFSYCYSVNNIGRVMSTFIHDREKTDVAKALFYYCTEKENYALLEDLFSYNESKNVLRSFVEKQSK